MSDNNRPPIERVHYFSGEALLTEDFVCEQDYNAELRMLLNSSLNTWGIADGLTVTRQGGSQSTQVQVEAGMAIDQLGRQIVLTTAQIVQLEAGNAGETVYLTIRYNEVYADYSDESGVPGYKRIVQQPLLEYLPTLQEPGTTILLAVLSFSAQGGIDDPTFQRGLNERRYVGARVGRINLITGAADSNASDSIQLQALNEASTGGNYLQVQAPRSQFSGVLTTRDNLGVGVDQPQANLELTGIQVQGPGTLTTLDDSLTLTPGVYPPLQAGDVVIPVQLKGGAPLSPPNAVIKSLSGIAEDGTQIYAIEQPFEPKTTARLSYSYIRKTLVRFSISPYPEKPEEIFRIDNDGSVGLGRQLAQNAGTAGPAALQITSGRKVGIYFDDATIEPQEALEVNGTVKALLFEGSGSKLTDLPIPSYWTKVDPASPQSAIYYDLGNVGVLTTNPPASLSVGNGNGLVGAGLISANADKPSTCIDGQGTAFMSQVQIGDTILVGYMPPQWRKIKSIDSRQQLELQDQFPIILQQSKYKYAPADSSALPDNAQLFSASPTIPDDDTSDEKDGKGTISSNGTIITGSDGADFSVLNPGDWLIIDVSDPNDPKAAQNAWQVQSRVSDTQLTVVEQFDNSGKGIPIPANLSVYTVLPALLGLFQSTVKVKQGDALPPPAMLVINNGPKAANQNTVAINMELGDVKQDFALQVYGNVNFSGGSGGHTDHLVVRQWAKIGQQNDKDTVLTVGSKPSPQLLTVTQNNVVVGASSTGTAGNLLEVGGSLAAKAMNVAGVAVESNGSVALFGARQAIPIGVDNQVFAGSSTTDGFIVVSFGPQQMSQYPPDFFAMLTCSLQDGSFYRASASFEYHQDDNGVFQNPVFGNLSVPVRKNESWTLSLDVKWNYFCNLLIQAYWVPFGPNSAAMSMSAS